LVWHRENAPALHRFAAKLGWENRVLDIAPPASLAAIVVVDHFLLEVFIIDTEYRAGEGAIL